MASFPRPPANSSFRLYLVARTISVFGDRFNEVTVPIIVLAATDSAFTAGIVTAANRVPALLFALPIGTLVDHVSRHRLMLIADYSRAGRCRSKTSPQSKRQSPTHHPDRRLSFRRVQTLVSALPIARSRRIETRPEHA